MQEKDRTRRYLQAADRSFPSITCPECQGRMHAVHPRRKDVDWCDCGALWLDHGEESVLRERHGEGWWLVLEPLFWLPWFFS